VTYDFAFITNFFKNYTRVKELLWWTVFIYLTDDLERFCVQKVFHLGYHLLISALPLLSTVIAKMYDQMGLVVHSTAG
jgi:hypothetical protein